MRKVSESGDDSISAQGCTTFNDLLEVSRKLNTADLKKLKSAKVPISYLTTVLANKDSQVL